MEIKYVVIVQCDLAHKKCSGFACTDSFYKKESSFKGYNKEVKYISFTCGGCCGKGVSTKLGHFSKQIIKAEGINKDQVAVHLSSCMVTDNYHYDRCPHLEYIKGIVLKKGYNNLIEGSYISKNATIKREKGIYKSY